MGKGGIRGSCGATLLIIAGILIGLAVLSALVGAILLGTAHAFRAVAHAHESNATTTSHLHDKLEDIRTQGVQIAGKMWRGAIAAFAVAGTLALMSLVMLVLGCVVGRRGPPLAPPIEAAPDACPTAPAGSYPTAPAGSYPTASAGEPPPLGASPTSPVPPNSGLPPALPGEALPPAAEPTAGP